jgi:hypothetical protein
MLKNLKASLKSLEALLKTRIDSIWKNILEKKEISYDVEDLKWIKIFWKYINNKNWEYINNDNWIYLTKQTIIELLERDDKEDVVRDFNENLLKYYEEFFDFKEINPNDICVDNYFVIDNNMECKINTNIDKHYVVTFDCLKYLIHSVQTEKSKLLINYIYKTQELADIIECINYKKKHL